jgi:hypothetical protein
MHHRIRKGYRVLVMIWTTLDNWGTVVLCAEKKFLYNRRRIDDLDATASRVPEQDYSRPLLILHA